MQVKTGVNILCTNFMCEHKLNEQPNKKRIAYTFFAYHYIEANSKVEKKWKIPYMHMSAHFNRKLWSKENENSKHCFGNYLFVHLFSVVIFTLINLKFKFAAFKAYGVPFVWHSFQYPTVCQQLLFDSVTLHTAFSICLFWENLWYLICSIHVEMLIKLFGVRCVYGKMLCWLSATPNEHDKNELPLLISCTRTKGKTLLDTERFVTFGDKHNNTYPFVTFKNIWNKRMGPMWCGLDYCC